MRRARESAPSAGNLEEETTRFAAPESTVRPTVRRVPAVADVSRARPFEGLASLESAREPFESSPDLYTGETGVSDVIVELARLSDTRRIPRLMRDLAHASSPLSQPEAFIASMVGTNLSIQAILDMSPMGEDETLRFLARLVTDRVITV